MIVQQVGTWLKVPPIRAVFRLSRRSGVLFYRAFHAAVSVMTNKQFATRGCSQAACYAPVPVPVRAQQEKGQLLLEFAFVFPLLFVFVLLIVDFGFAMDRREVIQHAVREGARVGAVGSNVPTITAATDEQAGGALDNITVCYVDGGDAGSFPGNAGDSVRVSGSYTHGFTIGDGAFLGPVVPDLTMTPSAEARLEKQVPIPVAC